VVELPVSGGLGDYWEPDEQGGFSHFSPIGCPPADGIGGLERQLQLFCARLDDLAPGEVDIYQIHFHLYEFLSPGGIDRSRLERARALLDRMAGDARVGFAAPSAAVEAWREMERRG